MSESKSSCAASSASATDEDSIMFVRATGPQEYDNFLSAGKISDVNIDNPFGNTVLLYIIRCELTNLLDYEITCAICSHHILQGMSIGHKVAVHHYT